MTDASPHDATIDLDEIDRRLLNDFQRDFPLEPRPFATVGERLGIGEEEVIRRLERLAERGVVSRVGPVFAPNRVGASVLAAMSVPGSRLEEVAGVVNSHPEVNHNYEREHAYNLWFVVVAESAERVAAVLRDIASETGLEVLDFPLERAYHIDLGFALWR